jgi:membrane protein DedA with SNARE-associated domain
MLTAADAVDDLTGLTGLFARLIDGTGEVGVGVLTLVETVVPPVPSEIVLPLSGFLAQQGRLAIVWVLLAATLGSLAGAFAFYGLGAALGLERSVRLLSKVPLLDREDLEAASDWFGRHGRGSVFFGRFVPGVRSLISLPAGAQRMPLGLFTACTALGSALWNSLLVGAGYALGTQWSTVGGYVSTASDVVIGLLVAVTVVTLVRRRRRRRRRAVDESPPAVDELR